MKRYEKPMVELNKFDVEDIILISGLPETVDTRNSEYKEKVIEATQSQFDIVADFGAYEW